MLPVSCVCQFIVFMLCLWIHICLHELFFVCVYAYIFIYPWLCVCTCVHVPVYVTVCGCVFGFKWVCVVPLLVSGTEPLLTVISLFMQCEKGLAGAWTPHALIPLRYSPLVDPHAPPPPFRHPALVPSPPPSNSTPAQFCPPSMCHVVPPSCPTLLTSET